MFFRRSLDCSYAASKILVLNLSIKSRNPPATAPFSCHSPVLVVHIILDNCTKKPLAPQDGAGGWFLLCLLGDGGLVGRVSIPPGLGLWISLREKGVLVACDFFDCPAAIFFRFSELF